MTVADHKKNADLQALVDNERDVQGVLKNEIAGFNATMHSHEERQKELQAEVAQLQDAGH